MEHVILDFWFNKVSSWFSKDNDTLITELFKEILIKGENNELEHWKETYEGKLAYIILFDQFTRNIYRDINPYCNDNRALCVAKEFNDFTGVSDKHLVFILMPFRHSRKEENLRYILDVIKNRHTSLINNFRFHTMKQLNTKLTKYYSVLEKPFEFNLLLHGNTETPLFNTLSSFVKNEKKVIVSLSGGVDSMVILYLLKQIDIEVHALHIDYTNREESFLEREFLEKFCQYIKVPLHIRILDFKRNEIDREEYEEATRKIRFTEYKNLINKLQDVMGVILGHHHGDIQENIIFNIMKGRGIYDLTVLKETSIQNDVPILRPLLVHSKEEIYDFAHKINLPYFKNTTPSWSNRGKFREKLLPCLIDVFGSGVLKNIDKIGRESDEVKQLLERDLEDLSKIEDKPLIFWKYYFKNYCEKNNIKQVSYKTLELLHNKIKNKQEGNITLSKDLICTLTKEKLKIKLLK